MKHLFSFTMESYNILILRSFQLVCLITFLVLVSIQVQLYVENKDSSSVGYRRFNQERKDIYPAVSICLQSRQGAIFKGDHFILKTLGSNGGKIYQDMLLGSKNATDEEYNISYNQVTKNLFDDFVEVYFTMTKQGEIIDTWQPNPESNDTGNLSDIKHPFFRSYQDPYITCMTKKVEFVQNQLLNLGSLVLNAPSFYKSNIENLLVYMHHPGQLIRQFGKQILHLTPSNFRKALNGSDNYYSIHINQVEVLRKRPDGAVPCNSSLENEDILWREKIMQHVGCIPPYWSELHPGSKTAFNDELYKCNTTEQLQLIREHFLPPKHTDNGTNLYIGPCNQFGITASVIQSDLEENLILGFNYVVEEYRETVNRRAFGFKSLWSQIGGFIGMFLGCGLLQVPELTKGFLTWLKKVRSQNFEEAFLAVNNIADLTISMEPAPKRDTSNCTELSSVPRDQSQELSKNDNSIYRDVYLAPNGTANKFHAHLECSNNLHSQVEQKDSIGTLKNELERAHQLIAIEQENSKDLRLKYELWHQKEDQYIRLIDDLHKRIDSMEKKTSHTITYIDEV